MALNPSMKLKDIDLVMREDDFVIYAGGAPRGTSGGRQVARKDSRLPKHLMTGHAPSNEPSDRVLGRLLFSCKKDHLEQGEGLLQDKLQKVPQSDYPVRQKTEKSSPANLDKLTQLAKNNKQIFNLIFRSAHDLLHVKAPECKTLMEEIIGHGGDAFYKNKSWNKMICLR